MAADFERLCAEFACPEQAKAYGSDYHRQDGDAGAQIGHIESASIAPKKGSLRVFAQQVCIRMSNLNCHDALHAAWFVWRPLWHPPCGSAWGLNI